MELVFIKPEEIPVRGKSQEYVNVVRAFVESGEDAALVNDAGSDSKQVRSTYEKLRHAALRTSDSVRVCMRGGVIYMERTDGGDA